ncbi:hypothetical protein K402DRAFT_391902, partial [Aulographum hederae CBS 113979]
MDPSTPPHSPQWREHDTIKRARFFDAYDNKENATSLGEICRQPDIDLPPSTARTWLKKRELLGDQALRRTRKINSRLGRKSKVSASDLEKITNQKDPIHEEPYENQAKTLDGKPSARTLQHHTAQDGARRFKKPSSSEISKKNKAVRVEYGQVYEKETLTGFWQWVWFTDEAHFLSAQLQNKAEFELRHPGQERSIKETKTSGLAVKIHCAAGVSYNHKGPLIFYKDPKEPSEKTYKPRKPRKTMYQTQEQYQKEVEKWEAAQPEAEVIPKGNAMSQEFYAREILPKHIKEIKALEEHYHRRFRFQEDGDPSHGIRSINNPCARLKRDADLLVLVHPAQSPDLNPIEACWQILKERLRGGNWQTVAEFKAAIQREWDGITIAAIRKRIREMPWRCKRVQEL